MCKVPQCFIGLDVVLLPCRWLSTTTQGNQKCSYSGIAQFTDEEVKFTVSFSLVVAAQLLLARTVISSLICMQHLQSVADIMVLQQHAQSHCKVIGEVGLNFDCAY